MESNVVTERIDPAAILDGRPWVMTEAECRWYDAWIRAFDVTSGNFANL